MNEDLPDIDLEQIQPIDIKHLAQSDETSRVLCHLGAEVRIFNPTGLPLVDDAPDTHEKVQELREL